MNLQSKPKTSDPDAIHVFADTASSSLPWAEVLELHQEYLNCEATHGGMEARHLFADRLEGFYTAAAGLIGAQPHEIAFAINASSAWSMVLNALDLSGGDEIILHDTEFLSNYFAARTLAARRGVIIRMANSDDTGRVDMKSLGQLITPRTRLIACVHIPAHTGLINPVEAVGKLARRHEVPFLLDAAQSLGHLDMTGTARFCDFLIGTGRKFLRGPRGTGLLYVADSQVQHLRPIAPDLMSTDLDMARGTLTHTAAARMFESNDRPYAAQAALGVALRQVEEVGQSWIATRIRTLAGNLRSDLNSISGVQLLDPEDATAGIVTFRLQSCPAAEARSYLAARGILVAEVPARAFLNVDRRADGNRLRASVHHFNTAAQLAHLADEIEILSSKSR